MIATFDIKGFKSIRDIHLDCRRINLFIGEPNTGKSNILEALGFLSWLGQRGDLHEYVRFDLTQNLFYDGLYEKGGWRLGITGSANEIVTCEGYESGAFQFSRGGKRSFPLRHNEQPSISDTKELGFIRFYRFSQEKETNAEELEFLLPPNGRNIVALVYSSRELRQLVADFFAPYGLELVIKPHEHKFEIQKRSAGVAIGFPYYLASDTLQRMVFFTVAIESSRGATLVFEEPEAHAFPYFTKHLGERIALDENRNQYFIATHNPYLLSSIVEKAPAEEVAVFATFYRNYETRVKRLTPEELARLFEADPFLGIEHLVEEES